MARIRTIKPEFWSSEQVVELSPIARLLFIGLWNFCDDGGNHPASPRTLKMQVFPGDDFTAEQIAAYISEMIRAGLITEYQHDTKTYWHVTGWHHQKIEKPNYRHPAPNRRPVDDHSANNRPPFDPVRESKGKEGKGKEGSESNARTHEENQNSSTNAGPAGATVPIPDQIRATITAWVETDDGITTLKSWKRAAGYSDSTHGPTTAELCKFVSHHLKTNHRNQLITDPVTYFTEQFPGWLANATQFNRPRKNHHSPPPNAYTPPPNYRPNNNGNTPKSLGELIKS